MSQKKKALPIVSSELHTISPLPIEMVAERIASLHYTGFPTHIEDDGSFLIRNQNSEKAMLIGRLMRWNGTFTRVDASVKKQSLSLRDWALFILPLIGFMIGLLLVFFGIQDAMSMLVVMFFFWPVALIALVLIAAGMHIARRGDLKSQKAVDEMMQALADKLCKNLPTEEAALEFDGSELSLELLLSNEKYKAFRMDSDGELHTP